MPLLCPVGGKSFSTDGRAGAGIIVSKRVGPVCGHANIFYEKVGSSKLEDEVSFAAGFDFRLRTILRCSQRYMEGKATIQSRLTILKADSVTGL